MEKRENSMIPFTEPFISPLSLDYLKDVIDRKKLTEGFYTKKCTEFLENFFPNSRVLLTPSCSSALELATLLIGLKPGDEVIMSSFTFTSTANCVILRGAIPVFVDVDNSLNMDVSLIENAITDKTKAIIPMHYAGVSCDMEKIKEIANKHNLHIIEDAAQAIFSKYKQNPVGSIGDIAAFSFHHTKNIVSGEGGAIVINDESLFKSAEIIRDKGTNRASFFRGEVDKYTWVSPGSSIIPSEFQAAFLFSQLELGEKITKKRIQIWNYYQSALEIFEKKGYLERPRISNEIDHNAHIYHILLKTENMKNNLINYLKENGIQASSHYVPLHISPMGKEFCKISGDMNNTDDKIKRLLRLPLFYDLTNDRSR